MAFEATTLAFEATILTFEATILDFGTAILAFEAMTYLATFEYPIFTMNDKGTFKNKNFKSV